MTRIEIHTLDCTYVRINFAILVVILIKKRQLFWILNSGDLWLRMRIINSSPADLYLGIFTFAHVASSIMAHSLWVATDLLSRKDLKRLEFFIKELQGAVLHPHHYLLLIARSSIFGIPKGKIIKGVYDFENLLS